MEQVINAQCDKEAGKQSCLHRTGEFLIDIVLKENTLSKILKTFVLFNSEIPCIEIYLKIIIIEEPDGYYARIFIGALYGRAKMLETTQVSNNRQLVEKIMVHPYGVIYTVISCWEEVMKRPSPYLQRGTLPIVFLILLSLALW